MLVTSTDNNRTMLVTTPDADEVYLVATGQNASVVGTGSVEDLSLIMAEYRFVQKIDRFLAIVALR